MAQPVREDEWLWWHRVFRRRPLPNWMAEWSTRLRDAGTRAREALLYRDSDGTAHVFYDPSYPQLKTTEFSLV